ncbi:MAG: TIGR03032 family protein [Bernardetiaceae bacterium]
MTQTPSATPKIELSASAYFPAWLREQQVSLGITTYQTNRLFLIGVKPDGRMSTFERTFDRPMGLFTSSERLFLSTRNQIWQLDNALAKQQLHKDVYDRLYVPRKSHTTGELDTHDLVMTRKGELLFINTRFSCLAKLSDKHSFEPIWQPPFISKLVPQDRCHLNGLALRDGEPAYATAVSRSDVPNGWRDRRADGGVLIDIAQNKIVLEGLSMPHSPRYYRDRLWLLNSGTGDFGYADLDNQRFVPLTFCPGFMRGLAFHDKYAIVGLSGPRHDKTFGGLPLEERLKQKDALPKCGLMVIDIESGDIVHWYHFEGGLITELFDVQVIEQSICPSVLGFKTTEINRTISFPEPSGEIAFHIMPESEKAGNQNTTFAPDLALGTGPQPQAAQPANGQPAAKIDLSQVRFQVTDKVTAEQIINGYDHLTFPSVKKQSFATRINEPLITAVAVQGNQFLGAAIAELFPDGRGKLLSFFVPPQFRGNGIGQRLLQYLEQALRQKRVGRMVIRYRSDWKEVNSLEHLAQKLAFTPPKTHLMLCKTNEAIGTAPWFKSYRLPEGYTFFDWKDLTEADRLYIKRRKAEEDWYPNSLTPFQLEDKMHLPTCVGLRYEGNVVGWVLTHQIAPDTVQYTTLFVSPELQRMGRAIGVLIEAISRQIRNWEQGSPERYGAFQVEVTNDLMRRFVERRMKPYLITYVEERRTIKKLT